MKQNWQREKKNREVKNNTDESDFNVKLDTRFKFFEAFWIWIKNKQRY